MASKYNVFGPHFNYDGGFGKANKAAIYDPFASRHETEIFEAKKPHVGDSAKQEIRTLGLSRPQLRDFVVDQSNPQEMLPEDEVSVRNINAVPDFTPAMYDLLVPGDFDPKTQVKLVQNARANFVKQSNKFDNPDSFGDEKNDGRTWKQVIGQSATGAVLDVISESLMGALNGKDGKERTFTEDINSTAF